MTGVRPPTRPEPSGDDLVRDHESLDPRPRFVRIHRDIRHEPEKMRVTHDGHRFEARAENVSVAGARLVKPCAVETVQPLHPTGERLFPDRYEQVIVRCHDAVGMAVPLVAPRSRADESDELLACSCVRKDRPARGASRGHVVEATGHLEARRTRHAATVSGVEWNVEMAARIVTLPARSGHDGGQTPDTAGTVRRPATALRANRRGSGRRDRPARATRGGSSATGRAPRSRAPCP